MQLFDRPTHFLAQGFACLFLFARAAAGQTSTIAGACPAAKSPAVSAGADVEGNDIRRVSANVIETPNFRIYGFGQSKDALRRAAEIERMRDGLYAFWLEHAESPAWSPKCALVLHATASDYLQAAGRDQAATLGFSSVEMNGHQVVLRRIDIRADRAGWCAGALAHELMHVMMAEECADFQLPVWADEGMALMADPRAKRELHLRDLRTGYKRNAICPLAQFLSSASYPCRQNITVFYGQSLSMVQFLVDRKSPAEFLGFLRLAGQSGYDAALKSCYGIDGVADLEKQWRKSLSFPRIGCAASGKPSSNTTNTFGATATRSE